MNLFNNGKRATKWIVTFIILLLIWFAYESKAEATVEAGITAISAKYSNGNSLILTERFNNKWVIGLGLISDQVYKDSKIRNNPVFFGQRLVYGPGIFKNVGLGIGAGYLGNTSEINGSKFNYMLSAEYFKPRSGIIPDYFILRHLSNAGSTPPNKGQDLLSFGYVFGK